MGHHGHVTVTHAHCFTNFLNVGTPPGILFFNSNQLFVSNTTEHVYWVIYRISPPSFFLTLEVHSKSTQTNNSPTESVEEPTFLFETAAVELYGMDPCHKYICAE